MKLSDRFGRTIPSGVEEANDGARLPSGHSLIIVSDHDWTNDEGRTDKRGLCEIRHGRSPGR